MKSKVNKVNSVPVARRGLWAVAVLAAFVAAMGMKAQAAVELKGPIQVVQVGQKKILADLNKMTAYVFDSDANGISSCYNGCAKTWPPILLKDGEVVEAPLGTTARNDGALQITFDGRPLYLFAGDEAEGDMNGDGLGGVWHIIPVTE